MADTAQTAPEIVAKRPLQELDTRDLLRNAREQADERGLDDILIVDADAHHYETESWAEIVTYLEDPILHHLANSGGAQGLTGLGALSYAEAGANQDLSGRITRYRLRKTEHVQESEPRDLTLVRRAMQMMSIDYQIVFPTPMLTLGLHPVPEVEVAVSRAYTQWMVDHLLSVDSTVKTMVYLPFGTPDACLRMVEEFSEAPGVVGFMVTSVRHRTVYDDAYMKLYRAIEERDMTLGFHSGYSWSERSMQQFNKFMAVHALGFPYYNMIHLTNWVLNGIPERFPGLRVLWIEGGLAWVPFLMQRLDSEYLMRSSEAPLLTRKPSEYIREMYFTTQPMEYPDELEWLKATFDQMNARTQLLYSSDFPHWDFDLPSRIYDLPFLDDQSRRNILGENARGLFKL